MFVGSLSPLPLTRHGSRDGTPATQHGGRDGGTGHPTLAPGIQSWGPSARCQARVAAVWAVHNRQGVLCVSVAFRLAAAVVWRGGVWCETRRYQREGKANMATDEAPQAIGDISRRSVLRGGLLAGAGVVTVGAASAALTGTAKAATTSGLQSDWAFCVYCSVMYWVPDTPTSVCVGSPFASAQHAYGAGNYDYSIYYGPGPAGDTQPQGLWTWCSKCDGLFWGHDNSLCAGTLGNQSGGPPYVIGRHTIGTTTNYWLTYSVRTGSNPQPYWRWCTCCHLLFWSGPNNTNGGLCPIGIDSTTPLQSDYPHLGGDTIYDVYWYSKL